MEKMFNEILSEKVVISKDSIDSVRSLIMDDLNKKIMTEAVLKAIIEYELEVRNIFTIYMTENLFYQKILLTWKEILVQNKKMTMPALIRFLKESGIIGQINIEHCEEILMKMIPPQNTKEHEFYQKGTIVQLYEKDSDKNLETRLEGDPNIAFHEFQLIMCRIALDIESG